MVFITPIETLEKIGSRSWSIAATNLTMYFGEYHEGFCNFSPEKPLSAESSAGCYCGNLEDNWEQMGMVELLLMKFQRGANTLPGLSEWCFELRTCGSGHLWLKNQLQWTTYRCHWSEICALLGQLMPVFLLRNHLWLRPALLSWILLRLFIQGQHRSCGPEGVKVVSQAIKVGNVQEFPSKYWFWR